MELFTRPAGLTSNIDLQSMLHLQFRMCMD